MNFVYGEFGQSLKRDLNDVDWIRPTSFLHSDYYRLLPNLCVSPSQPGASGGSEDEEEEDDEDEEDDDVDEEMEEAPKGKRSSRSKLPKVHVEGIHGTEEGGKASSFFSSSAGASFSAKNFGELNLSRPLVRACEALGYKRPTPIQVILILCIVHLLLIWSLLANGDLLSIIGVATILNISCFLIGDSVLAGCLHTASIDGA